MGLRRLFERERPVDVELEPAFAERVENVADNGQLHVSTTFAVPYIQGSPKDPSNFFLYVGDIVNLEVHAPS